MTSSDWGGGILGSDPLVLSLRRLRARQGELYAGALVAVEKRQVAAMSASDPSTDSQARAGAEKGVLAVQPLEHPKRLLTIGRLHAQAVVGDP